MSVALARWRPVLLLQAANAASGFGNAIVMIAIPWLVLDATGSAAAAGLVAALSSIPGLVVSPVAGWLVDRFGRRAVSVLSDLLSALSVAALPLVALAGELTFPVIVALAVLGATFDPAGYTARRTLLPDVATAARASVDRLNGIHEGVFAAGWTLGPLAAAWLIAAVGPTRAFWLPCALFLLASACVLVMRVGDSGQQRRAERLAEGTELGGLAGAARGFVLLWNDELLRTITFAVLVLAAIYMPTEAVLLPAYFQGLDDPGALGLVITGLAGGSAIGAFAYGALSARLSRLTLLRLVLAGTAIGIVPMALLPSPIVMAAAGFILGFAWGPMNPLLSTLVQRRVEADEQGRVYGVMLSTFYAAPPIAMLVVGALTERYGVAITYAGIAALLVVSVLAVLAFPRLREIND